MIDYTNIIKIFQIPEARGAHESTGVGLSIVKIFLETSGVEKIG
jgi:hypothetical protein